jgi:hypothetical protein
MCAPLGEIRQVATGILPQKPPDSESSLPISAIGDFLRSARFR